eukprot:g4390.t1
MNFGNNVVDIPRELMGHIQSGALSLDAAAEREAERKAQLLGLKRPLVGIVESFEEVRTRLKDGWVVTDRMCPITNFPLIQKGDTMWSVRAQMPTMIGKPSDSNGTGGNGESKSVAADSSAANDQGVADHTNISVGTSASPRASGNPSLLPLKEAYEEMSKRLLQGWTMTNQTCPISDFPLLRSRDGTCLWSVRCQCEVATEDQASERGLILLTGDGASSNTEEGSNTASSHGLNSATSVDISDDDLIPARPLRSIADQVRRDRQSTLISEKLLQGWKMLSETCPETGECPLMEEPGTGRKWSAATGAFVGRSSETKSSLPTGSSMGNARANSTKSTSKDDVEKSGRGTDSVHEHGGTSTYPMPVSPARSAGSDGSDIAMRVGSDYPAPESPVMQAQGLWRPPTAAEQREIEERQRRSDAWSREMSQMMLQGWKMLDIHCPVTGEVPLMEEPKTGRKYSVATSSFVMEEENKVSEANEGISALKEKMDDARAHLLKVSIVDSAQRCQELAELMTSCAKGIGALQQISE